jgi:hypothetical protein
MLPEIPYRKAQQRCGRLPWEIVRKLHWIGSVRQRGICTDLLRRCEQDHGDLGEQQRGTLGKLPRAPAPIQASRVCNLETGERSAHGGGRNFGQGRLRIQLHMKEG